MPNKSRYPKEERVKRVFRSTNRTKTPPPTKKLLDPNYITSEEFLNLEDIFSDRFYKFYRIRSRQKNKLTKNRLFILCKKFIRYLRIRMLKNEAGVFIENFGYFFMIRHPTKKVSRFYLPDKVLVAKYYKTLGSMFSPMFLPIRKDSAMQQWTMDKAFDYKFKRAFKKQLTNGKKYRTLVALLQNLYGRENQKVEPPKRIKIDNNK